MNEQFQSLALAVLAAPSAAEILVEPGIYREPLRLVRPVTIRCLGIKDDYASISSIDGGGESELAEIRVDGHMAVHCMGTGVSPIHIIGFRIVCNGIPEHSFHALYVTSGVVVARNCAFTSSSGPVCAVRSAHSRLIMQSCAVHGGAQGGILALDHATLILQQVHCCRHAACGLELRTGGTVSADGSHFYSNGAQGIMSWMSAGLLTAKNCDIHSNVKESGVLVAEAEAVLESCRVFGEQRSRSSCRRQGRSALYQV